MPATPSNPFALARRIVLALLVLGAYSQVVQAVLIREGLVVFYGNEASLGAFYGSWLFWLGLGSALAYGYRGHVWVKAPFPVLQGLLLALPLLLGLEVLALRSVRALLEVSASELVPLGELFLADFLVTAPSGLALGLAFPLACQALARAGEDRKPNTDVGLVSRLYAADALGALAGGVLFTFVLVQHLGLLQILGLVALALGLVVWSLARSPRSIQAGGSRAWAWSSALMAAAGLALAISPLTPGLERGLERLRFALLQPGLELLDSVETRYGHVAVAQLPRQSGPGPGQITVVADGQVRESFPQPEEVRLQAAYFQAQSQGARRILIFGGLAGGLPAELLRWPVERIEVVEDDAKGFERVRPYLAPETLAALADPRLALHFEDGRHFLNRLPPETRYDLVLVLTAAPTSAFGNRYFTRDFYGQLAPHLGEGGLLCTQVSGASHYLGHTVGSYNGSVYRTLASVLPQIAIAPGEHQVFCASAGTGPSEDPAELDRRYRAQPLADHDLPRGAFQNLLPKDEIDYVRARLEESRSDLDSDERPVTYYLNMILWGKLSASGLVDWMERLRHMGGRAFLLPPLLLVGLWLLASGMGGFHREGLARQGAIFAMAMLGLVAMAAQLALLFAYQARVGFMFERVALLNGLFMTGLALGAGMGARVGDRRAVLGLTLVMVLTAGAMQALPVLLDLLGQETSIIQEPGFLALAGTLGLLTGLGLPLAVSIAHRDLPQVVASGGSTVAADNLGGALGGLITGALMVPLMGIAGTARVLALLAPLGLVPLLFARLAPGGLARPQARGIPSFPWPRLGWTLTFGVLLVYGWHLLEAGITSGPQLNFEEGRLQEVGGPLRFEPQPSPFPHHLGFGPGESNAEMVVLASQGVAPEIKGFAGPLNLLLAVGRDGVLKGVRYLESDETPAYIAGIDPWLVGLAGTDLKAGPLAMGRVDGLAGATVSSKAALKTIDLAAARATQAAFGAPVLPLPESPRVRLSLGFWATLTLLGAFVPVYFWGGERSRLAFMTASLLVLGVWLNTPITEIDLVNLSLGHATSLAENPQRWLLIGFIVLSGVLLGPVWCGYLCPFGALQGLVSRLGRRLGLRTYPDRRLERGVRWLKYLLLGLMLIAVWVTGDASWAAFDPMQHAFGPHLGGTMAVLALLVLLGSLVYVRFWCRYLCPLGAFLALGNKLALANRLGPRRRYDHCDLGVRHDYDLDCIRCGRCFAGTDTRVRPRPPTLPGTEPGNP